MGRNAKYLLLLATTACLGCLPNRGSSSKDGHRDSSVIDEADAATAPDGCTPICGPRVCGRDPVCGASCGSCADGTCNAGGQCETSTPGGPQIVMLSTNVTTLASSQTLLITAIVTDPDGIDDVIGGTLFDPDTEATYGAFVTSAAEGAYQLSLTWAQINTVKPINAGAEGAPRRFLARFFDTAAHSTQREIVTTLQCSAAGVLTACDGRCVDLQTDEQNCGTCNHPAGNAGSEMLTCRDGQPSCEDPDLSLCGLTCVGLGWDEANCGGCNRRCPRPPSGEEWYCDFGHTETEYDCMALVHAGSRVPCADLCTAIGYLCDHGEMTYSGHRENIACDHAPSSWPDGYLCYCGADPVAS